MTALDECNAGSPGLERLPRDLPIHLLTRPTPWYGRRSGYYERLPEFLAREHPGVRLVAPRKTLWNRLIGKLYSTWRGWPCRDQSLTAAELRFLLRARRGPRGLSHILAAEDHLPFFSHWVKAPRDLIATIHFPRSCWTPETEAALSHLSSAIVLYRADLEYFESLIGRGRVKFVPHGVDTDFFTPRLEGPPRGNARILCTGQFRRNFAMLGRIIARARGRLPELEFDLVIAEHALKCPDVSALRALPGVRWHTGISDGDLRRLYQESTILLAPLDASGANNSIVEALASGLPIIATDVGGARDYGGGDIFPVVPNNADDAMLEHVVQLAGSPSLRDEIARKEREFAVTNLDWPEVARKHLRAYEELACAA